MKRIRILSFCLSIIMILSCMPSMSIVTYAEDVTLVTDAELKYVNYGSDGGVAVKGFSAAFVNDFSTNFPDASKDSPVPLKIVIPATTHDGKKVVAIADNAFYKYSSKANLYTLELDLTEAANLTTIGSQAFMGNKGLEYITIPDSVTTLSQSAFYECTNLKGVTLSKNITSIGSQAFLKCTGLEYIRVNGKSDTALFELPDTLETIDGSAFKECFDPTLAISMVIPKSVTTIGSQAFYASKAIKVIQIEDDDEDYTGYDQEALILEGFETSHGYGKRVIVMPNQACYTAYKDIAPAYLKKAISFEVEVNFIDHEGTNIDTQTKLYGQSLRYIKNDETELWEEYSEYVMPAFPDGLEAAATGYQWNWMYENVRITEEVDLPRKTLTNTYDIKLEQNLADPTILPTLNGKQSGTIAWLSRLRCNFYVEPDNRYVETIGVKVDHPLIETSDSKGGTVKFTYVWKDIKNLVLGPRNTDNSMRDENLRFTNEIKIDKEKDFRRGGSNYYIVEIIGWYVDELGNETKFFETGNTGIGGQTPSQIGKTAYTLITGGKILLGRVQFYLNGGTLNGYTYPYPIEWTRVPVGSHLGKYAESMSYSFPIPKKVGYNLVSWERQDGMCIPIDQMYDEVTTVNPTKYTAQWEKAIITLSFDANGGTNAPESITKDYGTQYALSNVVPPTPPDSFEFIGWFTKSDGGHQVINFNQLTESTTVYAQYTEIDQKRVMFQEGEHGTFVDATSPVIEYFNIGSPVGDIVPAVKADKGYAQSGWLLIKDGVVEEGVIYTDEEVKDFPVNNNVVFIAQYERTAKATVIFDYNGGANASGTITQTIRTGYEGDRVTAPSQTSFSRKGYTFKGWSDTLDGAVIAPVTEFGDPGSTTTYYAVWDITMITVTFDVNGGLAVPNPISGGYGSSISFGTDKYAATPQDGYSFVGWFTAAVGGSPISEIAELTQNVTVYAQYTEKDTYTVTFNKGEHGNFNGIESPIDKEVIKGSNVGDIAPEIILDAGYEFIGWLLTEDNIERGIYTSSQIVNYMVNNDVVFTAQYMRTEKATVIFDYNGGSATDDGSSFWIQMGYEGDAVTIPTVPTEFSRVGYTFNGWFTEAVGGLRVEPENEFKTLGSSTKYYAHWDINQIKVNFATSRNGTIGLPDYEMVDYGNNVTIVPVPEPNTGYEFAGWIASTGGIFKDEASVKKCVITEDITFTAQFVKQTNATAIFDANGGRIGEDSVVIFSGPPKTTYQAPNDPIKDGYIFKEWATTIGIAKVGVYGHVGSITMYTATWEEIENTVTFAANNAELSNYTANVKTGTALGSDNIPTVTPELGYSFIDSWDCSLGGTYTTKQLENYVVEVGVTFTANVIPDGEITDFVLTFDGNGGSNVPPPIKIANGSNISLQGFTATAPSGYYFDGWFDQQIGGNKLTTITMDSDKTVYAQYITIPIGSIYTITFSEGTDGVFTTPNDPLISQKITVGDVVVDLPSITANEDYSFIGWQIDGSGDVFPNVAIKLIPVTQDVKYVATYLKTTPKPIDTYTLSFNVGSGSDAPNDIVLLTGTIINVSGYVPTPPLNHAFVGWIDENGDIVTSVTMNKDIELVAKYVELDPTNSFTVTFKAGTNGNMTPTQYSESVIYGGSVVGVPKISANSRYTFLGWSKNNGKTYYSGEDILTMNITEDITFTAQYQRIATGTSGGTTKYYSLSFQENGGSEIEPVTVISGTVIDLSKYVPIKESATFLGWYKDAEFAEELSTVELTNNKIVYAKWKENIIELNTKDHKKYMHGYGNGIFRPENSATRAEVAMMFYRLLENQNIGDTVSFSDVAKKEWYTTAVEKLAGLGIVKGYKDGTFQPDNAITRAELVAIAVRFSEIVDGDMSFKDMPTTHWAYDFIMSATVQGWVQGYEDGSFLPDNAITRAETATIINALLERYPDKNYIDRNTVIKFSDVEKIHWAYYNIMEATNEHDYIKDDSGYETWSQLK